MLEYMSSNGLMLTRAPADGPRILFIHGASCGAWYWQAMQQRLATRGFDCHAVNLRGHPPNPADPRLGKLTLQDYVDDLMPILSDLGPAIVIGHSMGGALAQLLAATQPALVQALVLLAPAPLAGVRFQRPPFHPWTALYGLRAVIPLARGGMLKPWRRSVRIAVFNRVEEQRRDALAGRMVAESATALRELLLGARQADISALAIPRLTVVGSDDRTTVAAMVRQIAEQQATEYWELPGRGHMLMLEPGWDALTDRLAGWLAAGVRTDPACATDPAAPVSS